MECSDIEGDESKQFTTCDKEDDRLAFLPRIVWTVFSYGLEGDVYVRTLGRGRGIGRSMILG
jgi:hypothetical protein